MAPFPGSFLVRKEQPRAYASVLGAEHGALWEFPPTPFWVALVPLLLPTVKCLKCNAPPLPCQGQTVLARGQTSQGIRATLERPTAFLPVASPSTLGDQIYVMVKGLAGPGSQNIPGLGPAALLCLSRGSGHGWPSRATHSVASSLPSRWMLLKEKKRFYFSLLVVSALVLGVFTALP